VVGVTISRVLDHPAPLAPPPASSAAAGRIGSGSRTGFWLVAFAFLTAMAFSTVPSPLYPLYQRRDGFSTFTVTVVFAVYAVGVVTSLLLAGHVSDRVGRRRVLVPALALELMAAGLFLVWPALPGLILARLITGLGVGLVTATATAYLQELHAAGRPGAGHGRFELVSTAANIGGLGLGPLVAGGLAQFVTAPLRTPYLVFTVLIGLSIVAVLAAPETVHRAGRAWTWRPHRIVRVGDRRTYLTATGAAFAAFAVFGLFTSVTPGFLAGPLHQPSRLVAGGAVFVVFGVAAFAQTGTARLPVPVRLTLGLLGEAVGLVVLGVGMAQASLAGFLVGGAMVGAGAGVLFKAALGTVARLAAPAVRGEALAGLFLVAYLGLIVPVLGLGIATRYLGATAAMLGFSAVILLVLGTLFKIRVTGEDSGYPGNPHR
jgi:MFS family permease